MVGHQNKGLDSANLLRDEIGSLCYITQAKEKEEKEED